MNSFSKKIIRIVSKITRGKTLIYKGIAYLFGSYRAYRASGNVLNNDFCDEHSFKITYHRLIQSDGKIGNYTLEEKTKKGLLDNEKI